MPSNQVMTSTSVAKETFAIKEEVLPAQDDLVLKLEETPPSSGMVFMCPTCGKSFSRKNIFTRHVNSHLKKPLKCHLCDNTFIRKGDLLRHIKTHPKMHQCNQCDAVFPRFSELFKHEKSHKPTRPRKKPLQCKQCSEIIHRMCDFLHLASTLRRDSA